jgi:NAD(P)-dependent dehydrogenase (short-subunit alcohol dehydrogenase family)
VREFGGRVAVVTGAASGIGRAIAERCAAEGMQVVLADVEQAALDRAVAELRAQGSDAIGVVTDVSSAESVQALERGARERYGKVHVLFNNAGVFGGRQGPIWEATVNDWRWILGVNVWGVIHGVRTFTPGMLEHGEEGWIVNTASMAGLIPGNSPYGVSKHAVVALSEALYNQLKVRTARIGCSVLCPIFIKTQITSAARNRPAALTDPDLPPAASALPGRFAGRVENGQPPSDMADAVFDGMRAEQFYIWPGDEVDDIVRTRFNHILARTNPDPQP